MVEVVRGGMVKEGKERLLLIVEDAQWMNSNSMKILLKAKLRRFAQTRFLVNGPVTPFDTSDARSI